MSFESGYYRLGGHALCLGEEVGIGKREATKDNSRALASLKDLIMARLPARGAEEIAMGVSSPTRRSGWAAPVG